ncbi:MAG: type II toxin-antitoxin system mRNA interferase toxin, RelE/StbE family [Armatimonadota bacterium]|nr:type II toxin-antitoxin system mRNA interferase toxin, RelE/StbE family [Armatimonadota bacterium]
MLRLRLSKDADNFLTTRQRKHLRQIAAKIQTLRSDPAPPDAKALKGSGKGFIRSDIGEYRIIYRVEDDTLFVAIIGKRNDDEVYRRLGRK